MLTLELFDTGHCVVSEAMVMRGGARRPMVCRALVGLIHHPERGLILFDTGYAGRIMEATRPWPFRLYRYATPLRLRPGGDVVDQLAARGIGPGDVGHVIVSHFHADHVAGLRDFPAATVVASAEGLDYALGRRGLAALRHGIIPALLPDDLRSPGRALVIHLGRAVGAELPHLGPAHDLFGDGTILLVALPGHARGQIGALLATAEGPVLLAADGAWTSQAIREQRPPPRAADLIADDPRAVVATLARLRAFALARPDVRVIPTHCPEVAAALGFA
jgi:glyoxylase-like metal-dependent hydrolase (beta-lactamase superfamily II)